MHRKYGIRRYFVLASAFIAGLLACAVSAKPPSAIYPKQVQGVWQLGYEPCKLPGDIDSDGRIEIKAGILEAYEDVSLPLKVVRVSKSPDAWRITYLLRIDGNQDQHSAVYALSGSHTLTIIDDSRPAVYTRCN
jgi:hypothetical protein